MFRLNYFWTWTSDGSAPPVVIAPLLHGYPSVASLNTATDGVSSVTTATRSSNGNTATTEVL